MEHQQIKVFIDAMSASDLDEMEFSQDGWTLRLARSASGRASPQSAATSPGIERTAVASAASANSPADRPQPTGAPKELIAPLYGVVHLRPAPAEPPFVSAGQAFTAGQTLCLIEAMKTFVEVRAESDGTVSEFLVEPGQEVDAGQSLIRFA